MDQEPGNPIGVWPSSPGKQTLPLLLINNKGEALTSSGGLLGARHCSEIFKAMNTHKNNCHLHKTGKNQRPERLSCLPKGAQLVIDRAGI